MKRHVVEHGTPNEYNNYGCRCECCTAAWTAYFGQRRKAWRAKKRAEALSLASAQDGSAIDSNN